MKYATTNYTRSARRQEYVVVSGDEPTFIAWKLEGRNGPFGLYWRELCTSQGVLDPMQVAGVPGNAERFLLGERLRIGQRIPT